MRGHAEPPHQFSTHLKNGVAGIVGRLRSMKGGHKDGHGDEHVGMDHIIEHLHKHKKKVHKKHHHHIDTAIHHLSQIGDANAEGGGEHEEYGD